MTACVCLPEYHVTPSSHPRPATLRHEQGRSYLASLVNYWIRRSELTQRQLGLIADWGLGEAGWLIPSQISHLRNRDIVRGASAKSLQGLAGANYALWLWHTKGQRQAWQELGPHTGWKVQGEWLDGAIWLPTADDDTKPLGLGHFAEIGAGLIKLPYLKDVALSPTESIELSGRMAALLNDLAGGGTPAEGIARVLKAYPITEPTRQRRLRDLMLGDRWTREELEEEMYALAATVNSLRCLQEGSYGPADLHAELSAHRRRA